MPILNLPDTIEIPFDSLTNEQRSAIHTVMTGKGLSNPLGDKITKCRAAVRKELTIIRGYELSTPAEQGGDCPTCPLSQCPLLIQQQRVEIAYQLELILYWLDALEIHTDKLSGSKVEFIDNFFQRLSTAGSYTSALKSITGENKEKFSFIFRSLMGAGDNCLDRILNDFWGNCTEGTICGSIASTSGVVGLAEWVCRGQLATEVITCFLPSLIDCLKKLIDEDDLNYCQARKLVEKYAASQRLTNDALTDPIIGTVIKKLFATPALTDALRELENAELSEDFLDTTQKFFPEFTDDSDRNTDCVGSPLVIVGEPGVQGVSGTDGCRGPQGTPGPPGTDGSCDFENPCVTQPLGACCINGFCLEVTNSQCTFYNGSYYGDDFPCSSVADCISDICGSDQDCQIDGQGNIIDGGTRVCCGGQCIDPCPNAACGSNCPPCAPYPYPCCNGCGNGPCCEEPNICCNGSCVSKCANGGCPDCQGSCCPPGFTCCGDDGCCPDGGCCNGECCSGETPLCCGGSCSSSGNGEGCCGARACVAGEKCCGGTCVPNPDGNECCNDGPPCVDGETCCEGIGCQSDTECISSITGEVCGTISACSGEECPQCCEGEVSCDNGINCCEDGQHCCAYDASYCCDDDEDCTVCGCCPRFEGQASCCVDGACVPKCDDGVSCPSCGVGIDAVCCPDFDNPCGFGTCQADCKGDDSGCCPSGTVVNLNGECVDPCPCQFGNLSCPSAPDPTSNCNGGCPCPAGQDCCGNQTTCCDFATDECCNGQCVPKCQVWVHTVACDEQVPTYAQGCGGDCVDNTHGCCEASGGTCCGNYFTPAKGCYTNSDYSCPSCCENNYIYDIEQACCPDGFSCCNFNSCSNSQYEKNSCDFCGRTDGVGVAKTTIVPEENSGGSGRTCCLDGIETCTLNGCRDAGDVVGQAGGIQCGNFQCTDEKPKLCWCEKTEDVSNPVGCENWKYCQTTSIPLCIEECPTCPSCAEACDEWSGCTRDYDPEGSCCYHAELCLRDLTQSQCVDSGGVWQGPNSDCSEATCFSGKDEPCTTNANCEEGLECCNTENSTCQIPAECPEPPAFGRCCAADLSCTYVIENECDGTWKKELQCPSDNMCPPPSGCTNNASGNDVYGQCETWQDCNDPSFEPDDNIGVCEDVIGACCQTDGFDPYTEPVCTPLTYPQCSAFNNTTPYTMLWKGKNTNCDDHCNCAFGTCCQSIFNGTQFLCSETTKSECEDVFGNFTPCTHSTYESGVCEGPNSHLSQCASFGACCKEDGGCQTAHQPFCEAPLNVGGLDGTFMGRDTNCNDNDSNGVADICEVPEFYCCCCDGCRQTVNGTCDAHNQGGDVCCELIEGTCGTGSSCGNAPSLCNEPGDCDGTPDDIGACCYNDYRNCEQTSKSTCDNDTAGNWQGHQTCGMANCTLHSACCVLYTTGGSDCYDNYTLQSCDNLPAAGTTEWQGIKGDGTDNGFQCSEVNCDPVVDEVGACCFCPTGPIDITPGPCIIRTEEQCDDLGNKYTYKGDGTDCEPGSCGRPEGCCPTCPPPIIGDPGWCCVCDGDGSSNGTVKCGGCDGLDGYQHLGECPDTSGGLSCQAACCNPNKPPCPTSTGGISISNVQIPKEDGGLPGGGGGGGKSGRYGGDGSGAAGGVFSREQGRKRKRTQRNLPASPCGSGKEFCVEENGTAKCCRTGEVCCNGDCVPADPRGVCSYSSVTEKYYYCPTGYCNNLNERGNVVSRKSFGDRSNCPEFNGEINFKALPTNSIERTYSAFTTFTDNKDVIIQKKFDGQGRLDNYFVVAKNRVVIGRQNTLASQTTITGINASTDRPQQIVTAPVNFQIVNFVADDKLKVNARPTTIQGGVFKTRGSTDTQSKISKAELDDNPAIGKAGYELKGTQAQTIKGSLTTTISNGIMGEAQVMTFVSGSNIRLDTNTEKSFIRINVDDLNLWELVDVDDGVSGAANDDILQYNSSEGLWKAVAVATGVTGPTGATGPVAGSDKQVLFNYGGGPSGSPKLTFDYSTNSFNVGSGVTANFSGGISAGATCEFNDNFVHNAKLNDYSERVTALGTISSSPYAINIENGNVQTLTVGGNFTAVFLNPPASGAAGSLTLIITNGASSTLTWPTSVKWSGGTAPSLSSSGTDIVSFTTIDAGTTWYGFVGGIGFS